MTDEQRQQLVEAMEAAFAEERRKKSGHGTFMAHSQDRLNAYIAWKAIESTGARIVFEGEDETAHCDECKSVVRNLHTVECPVAKASKWVCVHVDAPTQELKELRACKAAWEELQNVYAHDERWGEAGKVPRERYEVAVAELALMDDLLARHMGEQT